MITLFCLMYFSFGQVYNQDFRSSTIEPFFEKLPDRIDDIDLQGTLTFVLARVPFQSSTKTSTYMKITCNQVPTHISDYFEKTEFQYNITSILRAISGRR